MTKKNEHLVVKKPVIMVNGTGLTANQTMFVMDLLHFASDQENEKTPAWCRQASADLRDLIQGRGIEMHWKKLGYE